MAEVEAKKEPEWVKCYLRWDDEEHTVKIKADSKEEFAKACGLLMRMTIDIAKESLIKEAESEEVKDESSESSK